MPDAHRPPAGRTATPRALAPARLTALALIVASARSAAAYLLISAYVLSVGPPALVAATVFGSSEVLYVLGRFGVRMGMRLAGLTCRVEGGHHLPRGRGAIYCSNHESNIDAPVLFLRLHPRLRVMFKAEMTRLPVLGRVMLTAGFVPVDRQSRDQSLAAMDEAVGRVRRGESFLVFPEGTRSRSGELLPFKKGGFVMAITSGAPVVPVAIWGGRAAMAKGSPIIRPATVHIRVGAPIETTGLSLDDRDRLIAEVRARIESMLEEA